LLLFFTLFYFIYFNIRDLQFPSDSNKNSELNSFIKALLNKKVNHRVCSISKLKSLPLFADYVWDDLLDFKIKPPFIPQTEDLSKDINKYKTSFEENLKVYFKLIIINNKFV